MVVYVFIQELLARLREQEESSQRMKHDLKAQRETARASRQQQQRVAEEQRMREIQLEYERKEREMQDKMDKFKREFEESQLKIRQKQEMSIQECFPKAVKIILTPVDGSCRHLSGF